MGVGRKQDPVNLEVKEVLLFCTNVGGKGGRERPSATIGQQGWTLGPPSHRTVARYPRGGPY
jgi:hypothetical protein